MTDYTSVKRAKLDNLEIDFTKEGHGSDEVTLVLENGEKNLYVSKQLLTMASPVFEAMFKNEFKEKKEMTVDLSTKKYSDFLELLECIHPRIMKDVGDSNVMMIVPLAEEYQVTSLARKCPDAMKKLLDTQNSRKHGYGDRYCLEECFNVLSLALAYGYVDVCNQAVNVINGIHHQYYLKENYGTCRGLYVKLPLEWKVKILESRLHRYTKDP